MNLNQVYYQAHSYFNDDPEEGDIKAHVDVESYQVTNKFNKNSCSGFRYSKEFYKNNNKKIPYVTLVHLIGGITTKNGRVLPSSKIDKTFKKTETEEYASKSYHGTKLKALFSCLRSDEAYLKTFNDDIKTQTGDRLELTLGAIEEMKAEIKLLKSRIKRERTLMRKSKK